MEDSRYFSCIFAGKRYYKKRQVNNKELNFEFKASNDEKYKVDNIWDSAVYAK